MIGKLDYLFAVPMLESKFLNRKKTIFSYQSALLTIFPLENLALKKITWPLLQNEVTLIFEFAVSKTCLL